MRGLQSRAVVDANRFGLEELQGNEAEKHEYQKRLDGPPGRAKRRGLLELRDDTRARVRPFPNEIDAVAIRQQLGRRESGVKGTRLRVLRRLSRSDLRLQL